jgi:protein-S-isoprenylcysteine O-methyltransferase Ste14
MCGFLMEFIEFLRVQQARESRRGAFRTPMASWWVAAATCSAAAEIWLYRVPSIVLAATMRPQAIAFVVGLVVFVLGVGPRGWSFTTLGPYFTLSIVVSPDQPVVASGPYRIVRYPSYTGGLLIGVGLV